jgi:hypothetical protein
MSKFTKTLNGKQITDVATLKLAKDGLRKNVNGYMYWPMLLGKDKENIYLSKRAAQVYSIGDKPSNLIFYWITYEGTDDPDRDPRLVLGFGETEYVSANDLED